MKMLDVYAKFAEESMAMPVIKGEKTPDERFPGADNTYSFEALMQDGKALQAGTSHFLGQNFSKASEIKFDNAEGMEEYAWTTSWGVSTRLIGGLIMTHADDNGMVIPPKLAPKQVVILPIYRNDEEKTKVMGYCHGLVKALGEKRYDSEKIRVHIDDRDIRGGEKNWFWIKRGAPVKIEVGPRDVDAGKVFFARRDQDPKDKIAVASEQFVAEIEQTLTSIHQALLDRARKNLSENTIQLNTLDEFQNHFKKGSGFVEAYWSEKAMNHPVLEKLKVTPRCIPLGQNHPEGKCILTGEKTNLKVIFAKAY